MCIRGGDGWKIRECVSIIFISIIWIQFIEFYQSILNKVKC